MSDSYFTSGGTRIKTTIFFILTLLLIWGCIKEDVTPISGEGLFVEPHMKNVTQLTFEGDNGEAYFSWDDRRLIYQSNRGGYGYDKMWIMNIDGSDKHRVSPAHGAHTCSFFFPGDQKIIFASNRNPKNPRATDIFIADWVE